MPTKDEVALFPAFASLDGNTCERPCRAAGDITVNVGESRRAGEMTGRSPRPRRPDVGRASIVGASAGL